MSNIGQVLTLVFGYLIRPQSSSYSTRQKETSARGGGAGDDGKGHLAPPFSVPISLPAPYDALFEDDWGRVRFGYDFSLTV